MPIFDYSVVANAVVVVLAAIGAATAILTLVEKVRSVSKPGHERMNRHEEYLARDHDEIANARSDIDELKSENRIQTETLLVMLQHMIDGNDIEALKERRDFMFRYLNER